MLAWLIPAILFAILIALEVYLRLWPQLRSKSEARKQAISQVQGHLLKFRKALEGYSYFGEYSYFSGGFCTYYNGRCFRHIADNPLIPSKKRKSVIHIERECRDYLEWLEDVSALISLKVNEEVRKRAPLRFKWKCLVRYREPNTPEIPDAHLELEDELRIIVFKPIIDGTLDLDTIKQAILRKYSPDCCARVREFPPLDCVMEFTPSEQEEIISIVKEPFIKLNEHILETADFYGLVERLKPLQERPLIRKLKEIRDSCLAKIKREVQ